MKKEQTSARGRTGQDERLSPVETVDLTSHPALGEARDSGAVRITVAACTFAVVFALTWAGVTDVEEKVTGSGTLEPQGRIERIEHPDGGVVRSLHARDNEIVPPGGVILTLDTDHLEREATAIAARVATLEDEALRVRYLLQADGSDAPGSRHMADPASEAFWTEQMFLVAQLERIAAEDQRLAGQVQSAAARIEVIEAERAIVEAQIERYARFAANGTVRLLDRERLDREALQLEMDLEEMRGRRAELETARQQNAQARAELLAQRRRDAAARWTKIEEELVSLRQAAGDIAARIARAEVRSATGGSIQRLDVLHPNEVLAPGDVIAEIVPPGTTYRAVLTISADRIGSVRQGMDVRLKVVSYDFTRFGSILAPVSEVSPTSFVDDQGNVVYRVVVDLPVGAEGETPPFEIRPGMTVTGDILTGSRSVLSYLLSPVRRIQDESLSEA